MGKLLFFDIDGTLVDFGKTYLYDSTKKALEMAKAAGHRVCLCTGRSYNQIYDFLLRENFDGIIGGSGEYVELDGKVIEHHTFGQERMQIIMDYLKDTHTAMLFQTKELSITSNDWEKAFLRVFSKEMNIEDLRDNPTFSKLIMDDEIDEYAVKYADAESVIYCESDYTVEEITDKLTPLGLEVSLASYKTPEPYSGEITIGGVNKASGMRAMMEKLGISREDVFAFGDGMNDIEMLKFAGTGVAMGNAQEACKEAADFVTDDIKKDGIYNAMRKFNLI